MIKKEIEILTPLPNNNISKEKINEKILSKFIILKDRDKFNYYFTEYNFQKEEENKLDLWNKIIQYLFESIFATFGMKISELISYCSINNKIPNLTNIIQELRIRNILILDSDISNKEYYKKNFPELNLDNDLSSHSIGSYLYSGVKNIFNFSAAKLGYNNKPKKRKDISDENKYKKLSEDTIVFNYELFKNYSNNLLPFLASKLEAPNLIIRKSDFIYDIENDSSKFKKIENIELYDYCLIYLMNIKKIILFELEENNNKIDFMRLMKDKNDIVKENDKVFAKLLNEEKELEIIKNEIQNFIENYIKDAKIFLQNKDRENAKICLINKNKCEKLIEKCDKKLEKINEEIADIYLYETDPKYKKVVDDCRIDNEEILKALKDDFTFDKNNDISKLIEETEIEENKNLDDVNNDVNQLEEFLK